MEEAVVAVADTAAVVADMAAAVVEEVTEVERS